MIDLRHGDCLDLMADIADGSIDLILADLPYNEVNRKSGGLRLLDKGVADSAPVDIPSLIAEYARVCSGSAYVWCGIEQISPIRAEFVRHGLTTRNGVWIKSNPSPMNGTRLWLSGIENCVFARKPNATFNERCAVAAWKGPSQRVEGFSCPKPVWLMERLILASSNPGDKVLDSHMGSGTTGVACVNTGRKFIGIEIDKGYFEIAKARIIAAQAAKAELLIA
jgi:site-specific DNA-methyltransferase (adenine-specific)